MTIITFYYICCRIRRGGRYCAWLPDFPGRMVRGATWDAVYDNTKRHLLECLYLIDDDDPMPRPETLNRILERIGDRGDVFKVKSFHVRVRNRETEH